MWKVLDTYGSPVGQHDIYFDLDGYAPFSMRVNLNGYRIFPVHATLILDDHGVGTLVLQPNVMGAQVFLDGKPVSWGNNRLEKITLRRLAVGKHEVTVIAPGFNTVVEYFSIKGNRTTELIIEQQLLD